MKPTRTVQLLMTAGLAVATATACLPIQPQGGDPGAAATSAGSGVEQASSNGSGNTEMTMAPSVQAASTASASSSSGAEQLTAAAPSGEPSASGSPSSSDAGSASPSQAAEGSGQGRSDVELDGWNIDYFEGFDASIEDLGWERYGDTPIDPGAMGMRLQRDSFTQNGELIIRTQYQDGQWSAGGASTNKIFGASRGRWEVRAKFPQAKGIGYAMLLWSEDQEWPPEVDFVEGRFHGPPVVGTYHWGDATEEGHKKKQVGLDNPDMGGWHTYGVIVEDEYIAFTFDGQEWDRITREDIGEDITSKRMFFGVQSGAMDPNHKYAQWYETVDGGVPGPLTPAVSDIQIDYVAHYARN